MTLPLTPTVLAAAYDFLCATQPFSAWNLPESEEVAFRVERSRKRFGGYQREGDKHVILVSSGCVGHCNTLLKTVAHELIHLHQGDVRMETPGAEHNRAFWKLAERVCRVHGWDPKEF